MTSALSGLGFTPYDYDTRLKKGHLPQWNRMLKEKSQGRKGSLDKDHLDRSTGDYDVIYYHRETPFSVTDINDCSVSVTRPASF